ncbi:MAG TPA: DUF6496 domain-containing protein [Candidatus Tyrphobacter sp.]
MPRKKARKGAATRKSATTRKKTSHKKAARRYSPESGESVREAMEEMQKGELHSGRSGKKVTNPQQAVAIGLSEARREGAKMPPAPKRKRKRS